jgi:REP element-mobilizing transposase RayT
MGRPLRIQFPGAIYHVVTRGVDRRPIFRVDDHRLLLLRLLGRTVELDEIRIHAYCLMTNHLHLLVETPRGNLAQATHRLLSHYAREFNASDGRRGHLFETRYGAGLVQSEDQLLTTVRYIVRNPLRAGIAPTAGRYAWSSHRATAGLEPCPPFLTTAVVLDLLHPSPGEARRRYRAYVAGESDRIAA